MRAPVLFAVLFVAVALALPAPARAETIYVDHGIASSCTTYDVAARVCGGGGSRAFPRIQDTFAVAMPGDVVSIRGGTYDEERTYGPVPRSGTDAMPITFRAHEGEAVHVQGSDDPHVGSGVGGPFRLFDVDWIVIEGLEISGFFQCVHVGGADSTRAGPADHVTLRDLHLHDCGLGIYVQQGSAFLVVEDVLAEANYLLGDGGAGLMIRDGRDIRVERMIARGNDDGRGTDGDGDGFHVEPGVRIDLIDCVADDNSEDGYDLTGDEIRIERSIADRSGAVGLKLWDEHASEHADVYRYTVIDSIVRRSGEAGIFAANGPHLRLYNTISYGNAGEGVRLTRGTETYPEPEPPVAEMVNCIVAQNGRWGRRFGDGDGTDAEGWLLTSDHDVWSGNGIVDAWPGEGEGTIDADPRFVDPERGDFHLSADSPAIDAGRDLSSVFVLDLDRVMRPMGAGWDIGAYERVVSVDGGTGADAALADGSVPDDAAARDASTARDAGPPGATTGGCACRASHAPRAPFALVALAMLIAIHRSRGPRNLSASPPGPSAEAGPARRGAAATTGVPAGTSTSTGADVVKGSETSARVIRAAARST